MNMKVNKENACEINETKKRKQICHRTFLCLMYLLGGRVYSLSFLFHFYCLPHFQSKKKIINKEVKTLYDIHFHGNKQLSLGAASFFSYIWVSLWSYKNLYPISYILCLCLKEPIYLSIYLYTVTF